MRYIKYMKTAAFILAIFSLLTALAGLGIGVCSYICRLVSRHDSNPLVDIISVSPFAFAAVIIFGLSRVMLFVSKCVESKKQGKQSNSE